MKFEFNGYNLSITKVQLIGTDKNDPSNFIYIGTCATANYLGASDDYESLTNNFRESVEKPEDKILNQLYKQLDRLRERDREINYKPFELRGELIGIYHLFSNITKISLDDVHKIYFERAEDNN